MARLFNIIYPSILALSLFLFGCGEQRMEPATVHHYGLGKPKHTEVSALSDIPVEKGDTLYALSRKYNVALRDLIEANDLKAPYELNVSQKLHLPKLNSYAVQQGDTLYSISRTFNIAQQEIVALNHLKEPYSVKIGQTLKLSGDRQNKAIHYLSANEAVPIEKDNYQKTDAKRARVETLDVRPDQRPTQIRRLNDDSKKTEVASLEKAPVKKASYEPPARSNGKFAWPLKGKVVSLYGPKSEGLHNDGINIAAPKGAPVQSTEHGVVAYVGNELKGFGNLLLIKHGDGYISAYGHMDGIQVKRGDKVTKGQIVGTVGSTGAVRNPQLHFELRKGTKAFDPMTMLGG